MTRRDPRERFEEHFICDPISGCWIWRGAINGGGYGNFYFRGKVRSAHRASYEIYVGPIPDGMDIMHECDVRACVNPGHLSPGTTLENIRDCISKGRYPSRVGTRNGRAKLTPDEVVRIRSLASQGLSNPAIAQQFSVTPNMICKIVNRVNWKDVA